MRAGAMRQGRRAVPKISIIIASYNTSRYIQLTLDSVLAQTYQDWEAVVVDDGSTDDSLAILEQNEAAFGGRLRYFSQKNQGSSNARNHAVREARGEVLALLDSDDIWLPNRLELTTAAMLANPKLGLVHANVTRIDGDGNRIPDPPRQDPKYASGNIAEFLYTRLANPQAATVSFRKSSLEKAGVFDESLRSSIDRDLWFRIAQHYPAQFVDETVALYRRHGTSISWDPFRQFKGQCVFLEKYLNNGSVDASMYSRALANAYREVGDYCFSKGRKKESLRWYFDSLKENPLNSRNAYMMVRALADPIVAPFVSRSGA